MEMATELKWNQPTRKQEHQKYHRKETKETNESKIKAVMFVPYTEGGELARKLRENVENINKLTNNRVKIIERTGIELQDLLTKSDPWTAITKLQYSPVPANFCCGWVE